MSRIITRIKESIGFRELHFYVGLAFVAIGGDVICRGAGLLMTGVIVVYYAVWRLR